MGRNSFFQPTVVATLTLGALGLIGAVLLLPACGVQGGVLAAWLRHCPAPVDVPEISPDLQAALDRRRALEQRVLDLQQQLALQQCVPTELALLPPTETDMTPTDPEPEVDADRWEDQDISVMEGCWELDQTLTINNVETGEDVFYDDWRMCITADGRAEQIMTSQQGDSCEGSLSAEFSGDGDLQLIEPANLGCQSGFEIFRREITCELNDAGFLECVSVQPDEARGGSNQFQMRRQ